MSDERCPKCGYLVDFDYTDQAMAVHQSTPGCTNRQLAQAQEKLAEMKREFDCQQDIIDTNHDTIKGLMKERDEAQAACAEMRGVLSNVLLSLENGEGNPLKGVVEVLDTSSPGQAILDELKNFREFAQALLPSVQPVTPGLYDKVCGEMYHELSERVSKELDSLKAENARLAEIVGKLDQGAIRLIAAERQKQITKYGFGAEHDDKYVEGQLVNAAGCILVPFILVPFIGAATWPWSVDWYDRIKSHCHTQQLVIAASLLAAEIDRCNREAAQAARGGVPSDEETKS